MVEATVVAGSAAAVDSAAKDAEAADLVEVAEGAAGWVVVGSVVAEGLAVADKAAAD